MNLFEGKLSLMFSAPWRAVAEPTFVKDVDYAGLRQYLDFYYGISSSGKAEDTMNLCAYNNDWNYV